MEISAALWAVRLGKDFTFFYFYQEGMFPNQKFTPLQLISQLMNVA